MDYSKLPKLSQTPSRSQAGPLEAAADPEAPPPATAFCTRCGTTLAPGTRFCGSCGAPTSGSTQVPAYNEQRDIGLGVEVWLCAIIGLVMIMMGWTFARYLGATLAGNTFHTNVNWTTEDDRNGTEVGYWQLDGYTAWTDAGTFLFGVALLLEAGALLIANRPSAPRKPLIAVALLISVLATVFNGAVAGMLLSTGVLPIISLLIVAFGGYMAFYEWKLLQSIPAPTTR